MIEERLQSRRSRQTGTTVDIVRRYEMLPSYSSEQHPDYRRVYDTVCVEHGGVCEHDTLALARRFAPVPREWCPTCQEEAPERRESRDNFTSTVDGAAAYERLHAEGW